MYLCTGFRGLIRCSSRFDFLFMQLFTELFTELFMSRPPR
ncbi:hypothetical protein LHK_02623 [Laribacter hongkongensis HLHK9]|uniref:Uncharacterized protein n=1 Tax=Laribacter hongkongensis (strain HLHK9) TaxID=557598 RepID=C1DCI5_LARHH|nr:hypothetical protein LHK_02623 [Laribacter hongkongensis HLHK9]